MSPRARAGTPFRTGLRMDIEGTTVAPDRVGRSHISLTSGVCASVEKKVGDVVNMEMGDFRAILGQRAGFLA